MMIKLLCATLVLLLSGSVFYGQESDRIPPGISLAFRAGNAADLAKYLNSTVEIVLIDKEDFYKKSVAEKLLKDFFESYPAREFTIRHHGSRNEAHYAIGNLKTEKIDFRVYFLMRRTEAGTLIHQIRIEPDYE